MPHIHEKIDFTVTVFVVHKDNVLLRKHDKYGIWLGVGGHIELDEDPNEAALREVKEEVGLDVKLDTTRKELDIHTDSYKELAPPQFLNIHSISDTHQHIDLAFFATADTDNVVPENDHDEWMWLSKGDLENMSEELKPDVYHYAMRALETCTNT